MTEMSKIKRVLILIAVLLAVIVFLDWNYLEKNIAFILAGQKNTLQTNGATSNNIPEKMKPDTLIIERLGINLPIIYAEEKTETAYQAALANGVVHFPGTANPGQLGNCYIFGHSSDFIWNKGRYKAAFALLPQLQKGEDIIISDSNGNKYTYTVINTFVADPSDLSLVDQSGYKRKFLTLQTSWPLGTAFKRWVVQAELK